MKMKHETGTSAKTMLHDGVNHQNNILEQIQIATMLETINRIDGCVRLRFCTKSAHHNNRARIVVEVLYKMGYNCTECKQPITNDNDAFFEHYTHTSEVDNPLSYVKKSTTTQCVQCATKCEVDSCKITAKCSVESPCLATSASHKTCKWKQGGIDVVTNIMKNYKKLFKTPDIYTRMLDMVLKSLNSNATGEVTFTSDDLRLLFVHCLKLIKMDQHSTVNLSDTYRAYAIEHVQKIRDAITSSGVHNDETSYMLTVLRDIIMYTTYNMYTPSSTQCTGCTSKTCLTDGEKRCMGLCKVHISTVENGFELEFTRCKEKPLKNNPFCTCHKEKKENHKKPFTWTKLQANTKSPCETKCVENKHVFALDEGPITVCSLHKKYFFRNTNTDTVTVGIYQKSNHSVVFRAISNKTWEEPQPRSRANDYYKIT